MFNQVRKRLDGGIKITASIARGLVFAVGLSGCASNEFLSDKEEHAFDSARIAVRHYLKNSAGSPRTEGLTGVLLLIRSDDSGHSEVVQSAKGDTPINAAVAIALAGQDSCIAPSGYIIAAFIARPSSPLPVEYFDCQALAQSTRESEELALARTDLSSLIGRVAQGQIDEKAMFNTIHTRISADERAKRQQDVVLTRSLRSSEKNSDDLSSLADLVSQLEAKIRADNDQIIKQLTDLNNEVQNRGKAAH